MENRRLFSRIACSLPARVRIGDRSLAGKLENLGLGGAGVTCFESLSVGTQFGLVPELEGDFEPVVYEVTWVQERKGVYFHGVRFPDKISLFWETWAASVLAGIDITNGEVLERRKLVRVPCQLSGKLVHGSEAHMGTLLNLGIGGALLLCQPKFEHGAMFDLQLSPPSTVTGLSCRVLRSWSRSRAWLYGVEFVGVTPPQRLGLEVALNRVLG